MSDSTRQNQTRQNPTRQTQSRENETRQNHQNRSSENKNGLNRARHKATPVPGSRSAAQKALVLFIFLAMSVWVAGCGLTSVQKKGVYSFGDAATALGNMVSQELPAMRSNVIEMKKLNYAIENRVMKNLPTREAYEKKMNIDSGLDAENIAKRIEAMGLLVKYGTFLSSFTRDTADAELKKNAQSLNDVKGLGQIAHAGGKIFIEWKKKKLIKKVVVQISPLIQELCGELEKNFDVNGRGAAKNVDIVQERLYAESLDGLKRASGSVSDRLIQVEAFVLAQDSRIRLKQVSEKILNSVGALKKADAELLRLATDEHISIEKIKLFVENTSDLVSALKALAK